MPGKDEMNLAEFPLTKLGSRDQREVLTYEGWSLDANKRPHRQVWTVRGATGLGLPNELGDRVVLALIALTFQQGLHTSRVTFSRYQLLKMIGSDPQGNTVYTKLETVLRQLAGITIESERAFYDKSQNKRLVSRKAFHLIEKLWLRKDGGEATPPASAPVHGYIVWGKEVWNSLRAGYIKNIDLEFYYSLTTPLARRLYRLLDKRMRHQRQIEIDIFEVAGRIGQTGYRKPSETFRKLQPSLQQLIDRGFLDQADLVKRSKYSRIRFVKADPAAQRQRQQKQAEQGRVLAQLHAQYATKPQDSALWQQVQERLQGRLSVSQYTMLAQAELLALDGHRAILCLPHAFAVQWLKQQPAIVALIRESLLVLTKRTAIALVLVDRKSAVRAARQATAGQVEEGSDRSHVDK
jgi:hypothetical protein